MSIFFEARAKAKQKHIKALIRDFLVEHSDFDLRLEIHQQAGIDYQYILETIHDDKYPQFPHIPTGFVELRELDPDNSILTVVFLEDQPPHVVKVIEDVNENGPILYGHYPSATWHNPYEQVFRDLAEVFKDKYPPLEPIKTNQDDPRNKIDSICLKWANRSYAPHIEMTDFLDDIYSEYKIFISKDEFKRALQDAGKRGIIIKVNGRWKTHT